MATIDVSVLDQGDRYLADVTVREGHSQTRHRVSFLKADYDRLAGDSATPDQLVVESFRFLLEREPKESILRSFDLTVIGRYFPEYKSSIRGRL
jgi:hypothetical protein